MKIMKKVLAIAVLGILGYGAQAQGLQKNFVASCDCYEIKNHFDNGQVSTVFFENEKGQKNGQETVFYQNGNIQYQRTWKNNKLDGTGNHYFRDGNLYFTEVYENGKKTGAWKYYDDQGDLKQEIAYSGLNSDGVYKYYHAGTLYLEQTITQGQIANQVIHNQIIYDNLLQEYEQNRNVTTK